MSRKKLIRNSSKIDEAYDRWHSKTPLIKELVKNLPNLIINKGSFDIADPDTRFLDRKSAKVLGLWEMPCKPTRDFNDIW